jgi:hypothetical protein
LPLDRLYSTALRDIGLPPPPTEAERKADHDAYAPQVNLIYDKLRNVRPDIIGIEFESRCLNAP